MKPCTGRRSTTLWACLSRRRPIYSARTVMSSPHRPKSPSSFVTCTTLAALMCVTHLAIAQDSNDAAIGKSLYEAKCSACHSVDANRTGPLHRGVVGRPVASVPGFTYSPALQRLGGVWTPERLDLWLQNL